LPGKGTPLTLDVKVMEVQTSRFGSIQISADDVIRFTDGVPGFPDCRDWVLLADGRSAALAWLQSVDRPDVAFAVVSPRRYVPGYRLHVARRELESLEVDNLQAIRVLAIVGKNDRSVTLNLKAPLVINLDRRLGRQVIANGELPVQHELQSTVAARKRIA
jgi:flagellar assembly factor FliW